MTKKRMIVGYNLKNQGILAPGEPIKSTVNIPRDATPIGLQVDPKGDFVLFAEVWSHPEGTTVAFEEQEFVITTPGMEIPPGSWRYYQTVVAMPLIFFVFTKGHLELVT